jgi:hypothetical protein
MLHPTDFRWGWLRAGVGGGGESESGVGFADIPHVASKACKRYEGYEGYEVRVLLLRFVVLASQWCLCLPVPGLRASENGLSSAFRRSVFILLLRVNVQAS